MPQLIVKPVAFLIAGFLLTACPITFLAGLYSADTSEYTLRQIIEGGLCTSACWQSLRPGESTVQDADELLNVSGVTPYVVQRLEDRSPLTYEWEYIGPEMPNGELERLRDAVVVFSDTGTVIRVVLLADLCLTTVADEYGFPDEIVQDVFGEIQLFYPRESLLFTANNSRISAIARVAPNEFPDGEAIPLEQLSTMLDANCTDAFSP